MTPASWLPAYERPRGRRLPHAVLFAPLYGAAAFMLLLAGWIVGEGDGAASAAVFAAAGALGLAAYAAVVRADRRFRALAIRPDEAPMLPELDAPHGVLVAMWVVQGRAVTGADRGAMWVEEGRLMFNGRRTSFVLTRAMLDGGLRRFGPGEMAFRLRGEAPLGVSFTPLFGDRPYAKPLATTPAEWLADETPSEGLSQLPPFGPGPDAVSPAEFRRRLVLAAGWKTALLAPLALPLADSGGFLVLLAPPVLLAVTVIFDYGRWALRERAA